MKGPRTPRLTRSALRGGGGNLLGVTGPQGHEVDENAVVPAAHEDAGLAVSEGLTEDLGVAAARELKAYVEYAAGDNELVAVSDRDTHAVDALQARDDEFSVGVQRR